MDLFLIVEIGTHCERRIYRFDSLTLNEILVICGGNFGCNLWINEWLITSVEDDVLGP